MHDAKPEVTHLIREQGKLGIHLISIRLSLAKETRIKHMHSQHAAVKSKEAKLLLPSARCS